MDDGVESFDILTFDVTNILADMRHARDAATSDKVAAVVEIAVEADHLMARLQQHRNHHGSDISQMSRHHYTHDRLPPSNALPSPPANACLRYFCRRA